MDDSSVVHVPGTPALSLTIGSLNSSELKVYRVRGEDALSKPFRYEIDLVRIVGNNYAQLAISEVVDQEATLELTYDDRQGIQVTNVTSRKYHGIITEFNELTNGELMGQYHYRLVMEPRLSRLALNRQSRIHATASAMEPADLITNKLKATGDDYTGETTSWEKLGTDEFSVSLTPENLPRQNVSHITQYNESDLDFLNRFCEHYGIYYFFHHHKKAGKEHIVFSNNKSSFTQLSTHLAPSDTDPNATEVSKVWLLRRDEDLTPFLGSTEVRDGQKYYAGELLNFQRVCRPMPKTVRLADYNYTSGSTLAVEATVSAAGRGIRVDQSTHFLDEIEGGKFAAIRAEEIRVTKDYYIGLTTSSFASPGRIVRMLDNATLSLSPSLSSPSVSSYGSSGPVTNGCHEYLVTHSQFEMTLAAPGIVDPEGGTLQTAFLNTIKCIEYSAPSAPTFRPRRVTPVPKLPGVYTAHIDAASERRAELDDTGAYKIDHTYDSRVTVSAGKHSRAVRKAEPYAGTNADRTVGMHFPLNKGTEVLVSYRNGDPDQPIITAAVPKGTAKSPVNQTNQTTNKIVTHSGALFEIHDDAHGAAGRARIALRSSDATHGSYLRLGSSNTALETGYDTDLQSITARDTGIFTYSPDHINETAKGDKKSLAGKTYARSVQSHILSGTRMVIHAGTTAADFATPSGIGDDDALVEASRDLTLRAGRHLHEEIGGDLSVDVTGSENDMIVGDQLSKILGTKTTFIGGAKTSVVVGADTGGVLGAKTSLTAGLKTSITLIGSIAVDVAAGLKLSLGMAAHIKVGGFAKVEGPFVASIGYGVKLSKKPSLQLNQYTLKLENVSAAEIKSVTAELKHTVAKLKKEELHMSSFGVFMENTLGPKMMQSVLHLHL